MAGGRADVRSVPRGFTLVELLLVLALLVVVVALAWPAIDKPLANYRLLAAADQVRTEWCLARVEAIRSGQACAFQYSPGGRNFCRQRQPAAFSPDADQAELVAAAERSEDALAMPDVAAAQPAPRTLPEGVVFVDHNTRLALVATESDAEPETGESSEPEYSGSIFFYPDGTTSDARLLLANERGKIVELTLRGLTGTVTVGQVTTAEEPVP